MAMLIAKVFVLLCICSYGLTTRFLPMLVWDHLNPQLRCQCNWPVVPHTDLYDRLEFVCPTLKIAMNQLDGYSRPETEMNENIFRRKWSGSEEDLRNSIQNGSIQSFCDPNVSTKLHTCRNGQYSSTAVTFKYSDEDKTKNYEIDQIYLYFNNADDGKESSLKNRETKCTMLFGVYVSDREEKEHDFTFGKKALSQPCKCDKETISSSSCPPSSQTSNLKLSTVRDQPSIQSTSTRVSQEKATSRIVEPTNKLVNRGLTKLFPPTKNNLTRLSTSKLQSSFPTKYQPTTRQSQRNNSQTPDLTIPKEKCVHSWISTWLLWIFIGSTILFPFVTCWLICILVRRRPKHDEGFNNNSIYYTQSQRDEGVAFGQKI